ncbi:MAG TPA: hybrid sensor histidine kinase/response regulator [Chloroflexota bacterium]|nr:hybrid sensor histidine kinase/response regulator [Chloroflexota bacterium]
MLNASDEEWQAIQSAFNEEAEERLERLAQGLATLANQPDDEETLHLCFREVHSLKGAAAIVGYDALRDVAHAMEDRFARARSGEEPLHAADVERLAEAADALPHLMAANADGSPLLALLAEKPPPAGATDPGASRLPEQLRAAEPTDADASRLLEPLAETADGHRGRRPAPLAGTGDTDGARLPAPLAKAVDADGSRQPEPLTEAADADGARLPARLAEAADGDSGPLPAPTGERVAAAQSASEGHAAPAPAEPAGSVLESVRISTERLDTLLDQTGELIVASTRVRDRLGELDGLISAISTREREALESLTRVIEEDWDRSHTLAIQLEEHVRQLRLLPLRSLFDRLARTVREASRASGKAARLEIEGADVEVDKLILERLNDPLMHLLRNAIDHGLEEPSERMLLGKPREGTIRLRARLEGSFTAVEVSDDGRGLDRPAIVAKAAALGLATKSELESWADEQVFQLIFRPGFSTSETVTELSGRGVGMDVVSRNVSSLEGSVQVLSTPNQGTTIQLLLPLRLTTTSVLLVQVSGERFLLPLASVDSILPAAPERLFEAAGGDVLLAGDDLVPMVDLAGTLGLTRAGMRQPSTIRRPIVVVRAAGQRLAFMVDELQGEQEVVIKRFQPPLVRVTNFSASAILPDGRVSLILNTADLAISGHPASTVHTSAAGAAESTAAARVLVVDDSLTARALQRNVLRAAGYDAAVAVDGLDAWSKLHLERFDLVITDVEMPNLNGFDLTERIRTDARLQHLPVIVVTSMESDDDKRRGMEAGADAYIVKRAFDHRSLLETVRRLL